MSGRPLLPLGMAEKYGKLDVDDDDRQTYVYM